MKKIISLILSILLVSINLIVQDNAGSGEAPDSIKEKHKEMLNAR